jgi:hypothetical protein
MHENHKRSGAFVYVIQKIVILEKSGGERQQIDDYEKGVVGRT